MRIVRDVPPHDPYAEAAVLSLCMTSDSALAESCISLRQDDFYAPNHRMIWSAIESLAYEDKKPCLVTVGDRLSEQGTLAQVGGPIMLAEMAAGRPVVSSVTDYVGIIKKMAHKRRVASYAVKLHEAANDPMCSEEQLATLATDATVVTDATGCNTSQLDATGLATMPKAHHGTVAAKVEKFVKSNPGIPFTITEVYQGCDANNGKDKTSVRSHISRLLARGLLLRERQNTYIYLENTYKEVDVLSRLGEEKSEFPINLPLGLHKLCALYPKNLVVVAGQSSAGKTAFLFSIAAMNGGQPYGKPNYLMAEMCDDELLARLADMPQDHARHLAENVRFIECETHFDHFIKLNNPDGLNICDYLKADGDSFLYVSQWLDDIHIATRKGVSVVAIQKIAGKSHGVGGGHTESKPRLYINLDKYETKQGMLYKARIVKAKFPKFKGSLDGMECLYNIHDGWQVEKIGRWVRTDEKGMEALAAEYWASNGGACPC